MCIRPSRARSNPTLPDVGMMTTRKLQVPRQKVTGETRPTPLTPFLRACCFARNVKRAGKTAVVVGPLLTLINQPDLVWRFLHGDMPPLIPGLRIGLTFAVPFLVSLYSSAMADAVTIKASE